MLYGRQLQNTLDAARKRKGTTSDPKGEQRVIRDADIALAVFRETIERLKDDAKAGWLQT